MLKGLIKDSVVYGVANAIQKLAPFFIIPVIIHQLGQTAFKIYDVSFVYAYLFSWLVILGQDAAATVFYFDEVKTSFDKKQVLGYAFFLQLISLGVIAAIVLPFKSIIARQLFSSDSLLEVYWIKALLIIPAHMLLNYVLNILLWQRRKKEYVVLCFCQTVFSLTSVYITIVVLKGSLSTLFYCLIGSTAVCSLIGLSRIYKNISLAPLPVNTVLVKKLVVFGVPFALTAFFQQALPSIDRYFLLHYQHQDLLPQYILAVKLGGLISMGISAFALAFTPYSMARLNNANAESELSNLFRVVATAGFIAIPVLLLFKDILVRVFADSSYVLSAKLLPFFFFGWIFDLFTYFSMLGIYKGQSSVLVLAFFATGVVLIALLNMALIPRMGVYGAAVSFCITKAALFALPLVYLRRHFTLKVHAPSFFVALGMAVGCSYLLYQVPVYVSILLLLLMMGGSFYYLQKQSFAKALFYK